MNNTLTLIAVIILILFSTVLSSSMLTDGHIWGSDFPSYVMQAKSVAEGSPAEYIRRNSVATENDVKMVYPWGTPVLLAPLYKIYGLNVLALKTVNVLFYMLFLAAAAFFLYGKLAPSMLCLFISLFAFNPTILYIYVNNISSDIPFLFFSTMTVFMIGRSAIEQRPLISFTADRLALGIMFSLSYFIRTNGILLVLTYAAVQAISRIQTDPEPGQSVKRKSLAAFCKTFFLPGFTDKNKCIVNLLPYAVFLGLTLILHAILPQGGSFYLSKLDFISLKRPFEQLLYYILLPCDFFDGVPYYRYLYFIPLTFALINMYRTARHNYHMILFIIFNLLILSAWPSIEGIRLIFPVLPFFIFFVCNELQWIFRHSQIGNGHAAKIVMAAIMIATISYFVKDSFFLSRSNIENQRKITYGPFTSSSRDMFSYIRNNIPPRDVIVFLFTREMIMLANHKSIMVSSPSQLPPGGYFCIIRGIDNGKFKPATIEQLVNENRLRKLYSNRDFVLYKIS